MPIGDVRVELPVDYRANVGYDVERWAAVAEFGRGLQGKSFHGGGEYRFGAVDVRGGAVYSREFWNPAGGVGFNMSPRVALDGALYEFGERGTETQPGGRRLAAVQSVAHEPVVSPSVFSLCSVRVRSGEV